MFDAEQSRGERTETATLKELALLFLRLGTTAFGGPAAYIAMMQDEVVRRHRWLTHAEFLDRLGASNLIPGPSATELAIHIGYRQAGVAGLLLAGTCFIVPAALISLLFAWAYVRFGGLPQVAGLLYGVKPVIIAVVVQALWGLGRVAVKTRLLGAVALAAVAASALGVNPLVILFGAGIGMVAAHAITTHARGMPSFLFASVGAPGSLASTVAMTAAAGVMAAPFSLMALFLFFLKIGAVVFGSGYVLLAFLEADLVHRWHWLTKAQLLDAVAVGQVTPGPVFSTATFIGYLLGGVPGAVLATVGIFLPGVRLRGDERSHHTSPAPLAYGRRLPRRGQCRIARAHGGSHLDPGLGSGRGYHHRCFGCGECVPAAALPGELGLVGAGWCADRPRRHRRAGKMKRGTLLRPSSDSSGTLSPAWC